MRQAAGLCRRTPDHAGEFFNSNAVPAVTPRETLFPSISTRRRMALFDHSPKHFCRSRPDKVSGAAPALMPEFCCLAGLPRPLTGPPEEGREPHDSKVFGGEEHSKDLLRCGKRRCVGRRQTACARDFPVTCLRWAERAVGFRQIACARDLPVRCLRWAERAVLQRLDARPGRR